MAKKIKAKAQKRKAAKKRTVKKQKAVGKKKKKAKKKEVLIEDKPVASNELEAQLDFDIDDMVEDTLQQAVDPDVEACEDEEGYF